MATIRMLSVLLLFLVLPIFLFQQVQVITALNPNPNPNPGINLHSAVLQESIVKAVNENAKAGWVASMNSRFSNYTVQYRILIDMNKYFYIYIYIYIANALVVVVVVVVVVYVLNAQVGQFKSLLGVKPTPESELQGIPVMTHTHHLKLPCQFDARTAWPHCGTIPTILDQGHCGSCWAFAAVESLSDRFCIHFGMNITLSVNDLLACCGFMCGDGCDGGYPISAWRYFVHTGVVTSECDPYFDNTGCSHPGCEPAYPTPKCEKKCVKENLLWDNSKHYSVNAYRISGDPESIMAEVYLNGPVEVSFTVYEDFAHYKSGVYKHITGDLMGGHAVKLVGWGTSEDGEDYWLLANQWNRSWGDNGYFKIRRGNNECGIEEDAVAGTPSATNLIKQVVATTFHYHRRVSF